MDAIERSCCCDLRTFDELPTTVATESSSGPTEPALQATMPDVAPIISAAILPNAHVTDARVETAARYGPARAGPVSGAERCLLLRVLRS